MLEARSWAYTAFSAYRTPSRKDELYTNVAYIGCGTDKMKEAMVAFDSLMTYMPENEASFQTAKKSALSDIRTTRIRPESVVFNYLRWKRLGLTEDPRRKQYEGIPSVTLSDIKKFQQDYVTGQPKTIVILGDENEVDMAYLNSLGKVTILKLKDVFGY